MSFHFVPVLFHNSIKSYTQSLQNNNQMLKFSMYTRCFHDLTEGLFPCLFDDATFNNISAILVEETGGPGENQRSVASH